MGSISVSDDNMFSNKRMSIAERRKLKKGLSSHNPLKTAVKRSHSVMQDSIVSVSDDSHDHTSAKDEMGVIAQTLKNDRAADCYKDNRFYMAYGTENTQETFAEDSMQPRSGLRSSESQSTYTEYNPVPTLLCVVCNALTSHCRYHNIPYVSHEW